MEIQKIKSPGGIEAWLVEEHSVPLLALRFAFRGGNSQDPEGKAGLANFITTMMDEGAGDLKSSEFQEKSEEIAMRMKFQDSNDALYGTFQTLTANRDAAIDLLKLAIQKPRFDKDAIERMRQSLLANLVYAARDPNKLAAKTWYATAFPDHPYGRPSTGTLASVGGITSDDLADFHKRTFARDNLKVVAVGDITGEELGKLLDEVFGGLPAKADLIDVPMTPPVTPGKTVVVDMNIPQSVAIFGLGAMPRKDPDFMAAFVLNHILGGGGFTAKLMEEVREKRGLAYSVYSYINPEQHASVMIGSVATKNEGMAESLQIIKAELEKMATNGTTEEDLKAAQDYLTGFYALRFDTSDRIAQQLLGLQVEDFGPEYVDNRNDMIRAITVDEVKKVAKRLLKTKNLITVVVGRPTGLKNAIHEKPDQPVAVPEGAANPG